MNVEEAVDFSLTVCNHNHINAIQIEKLLALNIKKNENQFKSINICHDFLCISFLIILFGLHCYDGIGLFWNWRSSTKTPSARSIRGMKYRIEVILYRTVPYLNMK